MTAPFVGDSTGPIDTFHQWLAAATDAEPNDPTAAALATATKAGLPSVRMVLVKGVDERGLRFFTNTGSQKGHELHDNPVAAMCFHWKSLRRQVRFEGAVQRLSQQETADYFHSRSRANQIAAAISHQSQPLDSRAALDDQVAAYTRNLGDAPVPLPESWGGFLLAPNLIEFWMDGKDRLHNRMQFTREGSAWRSQLLYP